MCSPHLSGQIKDYQICICCFSAKKTPLKQIILARNQDNVSEWSDMSTRGLLFQWATTITRNQDNVSEWSDMSTRGQLFQWATTIEIQLTVLVYYRADIIIISSDRNLFSSWNSWKNINLALNNNHSLFLSYSMNNVNMNDHSLIGPLKTNKIIFLSMYLFGILGQCK